jgi:hypothetical protein
MEKSNTEGVVHAWVGQKLLKRNILRVFTMSLFIIFKEIIVNDT